MASASAWPAAAISRFTNSPSPDSGHIAQEPPVQVAFFGADLDDDRLCFGQESLGERGGLVAAAFRAGVAPGAGLGRVDADQAHRFLPTAQIDAHRVAVDHPDHHAPIDQRPRRSGLASLGSRPPGQPPIRRFQQSSSQAGHRLRRSPRPESALPLARLRGGPRQLSPDS